MAEQRRTPLVTKIEPTRARQDFVAGAPRTLVNPLPPPSFNLRAGPNAVLATLTRQYQATSIPHVLLATIVPASLNLHATDPRYVYRSIHADWIASSAEVLLGSLAPAGDQALRRQPLMRRIARPLARQDWLQRNPFLQQPVAAVLDIITRSFERPTLPVIRPFDWLQRNPFLQEAVAAVVDIFRAPLRTADPKPPPRFDWILRNQFLEEAVAVVVDIFRPAYRVRTHFDLRNPLDWIWPTPILLIEPIPPVVEDVGARRRRIRQKRSIARESRDAQDIIWFVNRIIDIWDNEK